MNNEELIKKIKDLEERLSKVETRRLIQSDFLPGCVKNRAMGEADSYFFSGLAVDRPTGIKFGNNVTYYYCIDTNVLSIYDGTTWHNH